MNKKPRDFFLSTTLLLVLISMFPLSTIPVFAGEVTWNIAFYFEESIPGPLDIGRGLEIPFSISLDASGAIQVISPTNVTSTATIPENDMEFSHIFAMPEIGEYAISETYTLVFRSLGIIISEESFTKTDEWRYYNSDPSLMEFCLDDMYVNNYSVSFTPNDILEVVSITPETARPGDTGKMLLRTLRDIVIKEGEFLNIGVALTAEWHKKSSLTPVPDDEPPSISHTPVESVPVGFPIAAQITDNLKVDSATLYFKDAASSEFLIPMTPTGEPDTYEGVIPTTAQWGRSYYYFEASDTSGNKARSPEEGLYSIVVLEQIRIELCQGWNLFSICLQVEDNSISSVLESVAGSYESVWTLGSWQQYFPDDPDFPGGLDVITHGKGYWIDMKADDTLTITGVRLDNTAIWLEEGWNLVGYNHPEEMNVEEAQLFAPGDRTVIYTYEAGVWRKYYAGESSSFNDLDRFKPGKGYYIYVTPGRQWAISEHP